MDENKLEYGEPLTPDEFLAIPLFSKVPKSQLEKNKGAVARRSFKKGEVICLEGAQGSTCFYILKGRAKALIKTPFSHVKTSRKSSSMFGVKSLVNKMSSFLSGEDDDEKTISNPQWISIDAPVDLSYQNPVAELKAGDLFGEMTCLNYYPRSATVMAEEDCEVVEMLRNIFQACLKVPEFKGHLDSVYRERTLQSHLKSIPLFSSIDGQFLEELKKSVELVHVNQGEVIFSEGDTADALYLVRLGFVKVSKKMAGGDLVLDYLPRGSYFGEMGLISSMENSENSGKRGATCIAMDNVELVKIRKHDFDHMISRFPAFKKSILETVQSRQVTNQHLMSMPQESSLNKFLDQGLFQAQNLLVLDLDKCTRCDDCTQACAATHDGVTRLIREGVRYENFLVATSCRQCNDPLCMVGCPVGSIRRKDSLEITIEDWCIGCGLCAKNCPYGNINIHSFEVNEPDPQNPKVMKAVPKKKATTCDLCTDLAEPSCVYACPHDAAHRVDPKTFFGGMS